MSKLTMRFWGVLPAYTVMILLMIIPLGIIFYVSLMTSDPYGGYKPLFSLESYTQILYNYDWDNNLELNFQYLLIIGRTILLSLSTAILCLLIGFPVAYYISRQRKEVKPVLLYLVTLPFWVSMVVRVYAWVLILSNDGVLESGLRLFGFVDDIDSLLYNNGAMLTGMIYSYIPLMILPIYASIEKLDPRLLEAAGDLYSTRIQTLYRVIIPLCKAGIVSGFILVFVPCLGTVLEPILLGGGKTMMMGNLIQNQFGVSRNWSFGASLTILLLCIVLIFLFLQARRAAKLNQGAN
ncbi:ABC transporter permease [Neptunomonas qingdaonensis]|uniref:Spermidine/putrescine transport system permease protein n=1 Tax=Neptunomonas qingdaonensis TaxID=1045558 RepID=A0A1I2V2E5_9GAMM|nr:ABC transporter permease [Neptunomonas qingdaonensis]SFG83133.1 spermidine/putrescine transport system permease protein [Neptunomonas qingdaonensis]